MGFLGGDETELTIGHLGLEIYEIKKPLISHYYTLKGIQRRK